MRRCVSRLLGSALRWTAIGVLAFAAVPVAQAEESGSSFIRRLDEDGDGRVSKEEFDGPAHRFGRLDADSDGFIDADEAPRRAPGERRPGSRRAAEPARKDSPLEVITVGTGSPLDNPDRSSPSALVRLGGRLVLVDMGEGTYARLVKADIRLNRIEAFCFTHHHRDHNADAMTILPKAWVRGTDTPIVGPEVTQRLVTFLREFFEGDLAYRRRGGDRGNSAAPRVIELPHEGALEIAGLKVTTAEVPHTITTFAYRFDAGEQSIVISGDLTWSENLIRLAKGADVLVIDSGGIVYEQDGVHGARDGGEGRKSGGRRRPRAQAPEDEGTARGEHRGGRVRAHASLEEVARMAAGAGVRHLVLTHFRPGKVDEGETRRRMAKIYEGEIHFAVDMQVFSAR